MAEVRQQARTFIVRYLCDECGTGEMKFTGSVFMTNPPKYKHECRCGAAKTLDRSYPDTETLPEE